MKVLAKSWSAAMLLGASLVAAAGLAGGVPAASAMSQAHNTEAWRSPGPVPGIPGLPRPGALVPRPGSASDLTGVYCVSATNCWAVGEYEKGSGATGTVLNQVLHWNGSKWSAVPAPSPGGTAAADLSALAAVRCASARNCWAVGYYIKNGAELNEALHWNGSHWSQVTTPNPGGTGGSAIFDFSGLFSVTCVSASSCWAAGEYGNSVSGTEVILNQVLHWNGIRWTKAAVPNPAGSAYGDASQVLGVRCTSPASCWAVGTYGTESNPYTFRNEVLHWNGRKWGTVAAPSPGGTANNDFSTLFGLACTSAGNCWAVGSYGTQGNPDTFKNETLHWNGHLWSTVSTPQPDGAGVGASNTLNDVACTAAANCWAVGTYGSMNGGVGFILNQALHWNGHHWSLVSTPDPAGLKDGDTSVLSAVRCTSARNCWAVGFAQPTGRNELNEALRWNGSKWSIG